MVYVRLPPQVTCAQCILQWTYVAGNNWGTCDNGTGAIGCGPQENFRSCADIEIVPHPLLQENFKHSDQVLQPLLENDLDSEVAEQDYEEMAASIRRKEILLQRKKLLLKQLIKKLRLLIRESSELIGETSDQMASPQRPISSQILPPQVSDSEYKSVRPWWDRILSNKH